MRAGFASIMPASFDDLSDLITSQHHVDSVRRGRPERLRYRFAPGGQQRRVDYTAHEAQARQDEQDAHGAIAHSDHLRRSGPVCRDVSGRPARSGWPGESPEHAGQVGR